MTRSMEILGLIPRTSTARAWPRAVRAGLPDPPVRRDLWRALVRDGGGQRVPVHGDLRPEAVQRVEFQLDLVGAHEAVGPGQGVHALPGHLERPAVGELNPLLLPPGVPPL